MSSGILLVMALSLTGPIPNAASINSHRPDSVLLVRLKAPGKEDELNDSLGRLEAWRDGDLKGRFGFDDDVELPFSPEKPQINPVIQTIEAEGVLSSGKKIIDEILRICDSSDIREVRIDTTSGRKEDAAGLSRLAGMTDLGSAWTLWYTDIHTGTSVEIGGNLAVFHNPCLGQFERMWMNASPVTNIKRILLTDSVRGDLLTEVLNSVETVVSRDVQPLRDAYRKCTDDELLEKCKERGLKEWGLRDALVRHLVGEDKRQILIQDLNDRGIILDAGVAKDYYEFYQAGVGSNKAIGIPTTIFDERDGRWLEDIVALAIAEAWDCDRVLVGLNIGHPEREERMEMFKGIKYPRSGKGAAVIWSNCKAAGILDDRFSELDFFDVDSFDLDEYIESLHEENESEISAFVEWIVSEWGLLTKEIREGISRRNRIRDLDVFAETYSKTLFLECKLYPGKGPSLEVNRAQIESLVSRVASRGVNYTILAHNQLDLEVYRDQEFDYVLPWSMLRQPDKVLEAVIDKVIPKKWWNRWQEGRSTNKSSDSTEATGGRRRRSRRKKVKGWDGWTPTRQNPPPPTEEVSQGKHYCPECMDSFDKMALLNEHKQKTGHSSYKCEQCSEILINEKRVLMHSDKTGHKTFSGTCYSANQLWVPWEEDTDAQERLIESGFYDKAIENRWDTIRFIQELVQETGKAWRKVYGLKHKNTKISRYFNEISPGLVLFIQGEDGKWYASEPGPEDEEE